MASTGGRRVVRDRTAPRVLVKEEEDEKQDVWYSSRPSPIYTQSYASHIKAEYPTSHASNRHQHPLHPTRASSTRPVRVKAEEFYENTFQAHKPVYYAEPDSYQHRHSSRASSISPEWGHQALDLENVNQQLTDAEEEIAKLERERDAERDKRLRAEKQMQRFMKKQEEHIESLVREKIAFQEARFLSKIGTQDAQITALKHRIGRKTANIEWLKEENARLLDVIERQDVRHRRELEQASPSRPPPLVMHHEPSLKQVECPFEALTAVAQAYYVSKQTDSVHSSEPTTPLAQTPRQVPAIHIEESPVFTFHKLAARPASIAPGMERLGSSTSSMYETASTGSQSTIVNDWLSCCSDQDPLSPSPVFVGSPDWNASRTLKHCLNRHENGRLGLGLVV